MSRTRDRSTLVAIAIVTVVWASWRFTDAPRTVPTALIVGAVVITVLSVPIALVVAFAERRVPAWLRHGDRGLTVALVSLLAVWLVAWLQALSFLGVVAVVGSLVALLSLLVVLPLAVGSLVADVSGGRFTTVILTWPPALVAGVLVFLAPAPGGVDFTRYNATFLEGPAFVAVMAVVVALVVLGPAGVVVVHARRQRR